MGLVVGEVGALGLKELLGDVFAQRFRDDLVELIDVLADWFARVGVVLDAVESGLDDRRQREVGVARQVRTPNLELREVPLGYASTSIERVSHSSHLDEITEILRQQDSTRFSTVLDVCHLLARYQ